MVLDELPYIDEHSIVIVAPAEVVWDVALEMFGKSFSRTGARSFARLVGCDPAELSEWDRPGVGSSIPGFQIVQADAPHLLVLAGRHRFSRYGIVLRIEPVNGRTTCRFESRAAFPGLHGRLYRFAVVGTHGHVVAVRRLLSAIRRTAELRARS